MGDETNLAWAVIKADCSNCGSHIEKRMFIMPKNVEDKTINDIIKSFSQRECEECQEKFDEEDINLDKEEINSKEEPKVKDRF